MYKIHKLFLRNNYINSLLIVGTLFQAYTIFTIVGFEMDVAMICIILADLIFIIKLVKPKNNKRNYISLIFIFYIMFNFLINYKYSELSSLILSIFFIGSIIFTYRSIDEETFNEYIKIYIGIVTVLSIYGIYQFIGRINGWFFSDLYMEGHMIQGFNWTNLIWLNGNVFYRVNSIYREPSFYSQFTALGIIFILGKIKNESKIKFKDILFIIINLVGMILSFSGTGFLILIPFIIYYFFIEDFNFTKIIKNLILLIFSLIIVLIILHIFKLDNTIIKYFFSRIGEVTNNTGSGGIRFASAFENMKTVLESNPLLGYGIGSRDSIFNVFSMNIKKVDSTLPRIGMELGLLGIMIWGLFLATYFDKSNMKNKFYKYILFFLIIQLFNGEYFLQITNWIFLYFINCKIVFNNSANKIENQNVK